VADPQRTHEATPRRKQEFRKRGDIALSRDLVSAAALGGGVIALVAFAGTAGSALLAFTRDAANATDGRGADSLASDAVNVFAAGVAPVMVGATVAVLITIATQLGWPPAFKGPKFDFSRISPAKNLPQTFGLAGMARRTGSALAKLLVVGAIVILATRNATTNQGLDIASIASIAWSVIARLLWLVLGALVALGAIDYVLARRRMGSQMKMTADEAKREHRENEGDPMVRGRRRARMRELAKRRIATVATADVVVVNPTHYAVALRYDESEDRAPIVLAKGVDESAEKIREVARKHGVPILPRPPLARALHKNVKEGHPVPANLFKAVAEVLAYVYRLKGKR
jgi:flagellar biosynthetic protein FlhB